MNNFSKLNESGVDYDQTETKSGLLFSTDEINDSKASMNDAVDSFDTAPVPETRQVTSTRTYQSYIPYKTYSDYETATFAIKEDGDEEPPVEAQEQPGDDDSSVIDGDQSDLDESADPVRGHRWKYRQPTGGVTYWYDCPHPGCTVSLKIVRNYIKEQPGSATVFYSDRDHDHSAEDVVVRVRGVDPVVRKRIVEMELLNWMPTAIKNKLRSDGLEAPELSQINSILHTIRRNRKIKQSGTAAISWSLKDVQAYVEKNTVDPEKLTDQDQLFVAGFEYEIKPKIKFRIFISTKRLLTFAKHNLHTMADATYNLIEEGYPVLTIGTTDRSKKFHPLGLCVNSHQDTRDFEFLFKSLKTAIKEYVDHEYNPDVLIADSAPEITDGFTAVFGKPRKRINCWAHVIRNIDDHLKPIKDKSTKSRIRSDIIKLQANPHACTINTVFQLFDSKWRQSDDPAINVFLDYFKNWTKEGKNGWIEGYCEGLPSTSNAIESTHSHMKAQMRRERKPLGEFLTSLGLDNGIIREWSLERAEKFSVIDQVSGQINEIQNNNQKVYVSKPLVSTKDLLEAFDYKNKVKSVVAKRIGQTLHNFIPNFLQSGDDLTLCNQYVAMLTSQDWVNLDEYFEFVDSYFVVKIDKATWENSLCSCLQAQKHYKCKHIVVVASRTVDKSTKKKLFDFEQFALEMPLEKKNKRGRKKMPANCLSKPTAPPVAPETVLEADPVLPCTSNQASAIQPSSSQSTTAKSKRATKATSKANQHSKQTPQERSPPSELSTTRTSKRVKK